jgi:hypothetical protein
VFEVALRGVHSRSVLLGLFLIEAAAGLYLFLPLVGRRNSGVKFHRLILIVAGSLSVAALAAHARAARWGVPTMADTVTVGLTAVVYLVLRYPKRLLFRVPAAILAVSYLAAAVAAFQSATGAPLPWSIAGGLSALALLGSVNLAMLLGHWYLVVRGMPIEPLKRLTIATLAATLFKLLVVSASLVMAARSGSGYPSQLYRITVGQGIFFWMRVGWGLVASLLLFPMVWGTVKIRSTMAATGILYVQVVAVVIGEVLGGYLASIEHLPL